MWQKWDRYYRVFLCLKSDIEESHRFLAERSYLGKADFQLVFKDGIYLSYEIKTEFWQETIAHLNYAFGDPHKLKEIHINKPRSQTVPRTIAIAMIIMVGTIIYLVAR